MSPSLLFSEARVLRHNPKRLRYTVHDLAQRWQTTAATSESALREPMTVQHLHTQPTTPLARLTTTHLIRSILLGTIFVRPWMYRMCMAIMQRTADPKSLLYPDWNPITRAVFRRTVYDHFCAGTSIPEVKDTVKNMKKMGYSGVIVCPGREIMVSTPNISEGDQQESKSNSNCAAIEQWRDLHIETLDSLERNDYMGMKFTGAGPSIFQCLVEGRDPPTQLIEAMDAICQKAAQQGTKIWIDAEQQKIQPSIDRWTMELMSKHNRAGRVLISNTYQAYLKSCRSRLEAHLRQSQLEGWSLGVKLVRGAYITSEVRSLIHDTKPDTDANYDSIAEAFISRTLSGFDSASNAPDCEIFIAGHNAQSIQNSVAAYKQITQRGQRYSRARWGQLQGMADEVSCQMLHDRDSEIARPKDTVDTPAVHAEVYKCLQWGTVGECMQFLARRATENSGAAHRMAESTRSMREELWRRCFG